MKKLFFGILMLTLLLSPSIGRAQYHPDPTTNALIVVILEQIRLLQEQIDTMVQEQRENKEIKEYVRKQKKEKDKEERNERDNTLKLQSLLEESKKIKKEWDTLKCGLNGGNNCRNLVQRLNEIRNEVKVLDHDMNTYPPTGINELCPWFFNRSNGNWRQECA